MSSFRARWFRRLLLTAGVVLIGVAPYQGYRGITKKFLDESKVELRWAFADWGKIWGNPTIYLEWKGEDAAPDHVEGKLLLDELISQEIQLDEKDLVSTPLRRPPKRDDALHGDGGRRRFSRLHPTLQPATGATMHNVRWS